MKCRIKKTMSIMFLGSVLFLGGCITAGATNLASKQDVETIQEKGILADESFLPLLPEGSAIINSDAIELAEANQAPRYIKTIQFKLNAGEWLTIDSFKAQYPKGTVVTLTGTWVPSDAKLEVSLQGKKGGGFEASLINAQRREFILANNTMWNLRIGSAEEAMSGAITIETKEP